MTATTTTEEKLIDINAALAERAERLRQVDQYCGTVHDPVLTRVLKAQIRDLETEKHALLQELPV